MPRTQSQNIASGLGWFSIGLGLAEVAAPGAVASLVGLPGNSATRNVLRVFGIRELATGIGILKNPGEPGWIWARVAGDALDIAALWTGAQSNGRDTARSATATAALIGLTVMDAFCGAQLSTASKDAGERNGSKAKRSNRVSRSIIVDRPVEEVYRFWHDFGNLPKFMTFLESVESTGDRRSHWTANGPVRRGLSFRDGQDVGRRCGPADSTRSAELQAGARTGRSDPVRRQYSRSDASGAAGEWPRLTASEKKGETHASKLLDG